MRRDHIEHNAACSERGMKSGDASFADVGPADNDLADRVFGWIDLIPAEVVLLRGERVVAASPAARQAFEAWVASGQLLQDMVSASDRRAFLRWIADPVGEHEATLVNEYQICEFRAVVHDDTVLLAIRDRTSEHAAHLTNLYSGSRHNAVLDGLRDGVMILDEAGVVSECNRGAAQIFAGLGVSNVVGLSHTNLLGSASTESGLLAVDDLPTHTALVNGLSRTDVVIRLEGAHGPRWISMSVRPIDSIAGRQGAAVLLHDVTTQTLAQHDLAYLAHHDALTGLLNRNRLRLEMELLMSRPTPLGVAVMILDLDGFKEVNDTYGHQYGDAVLTEVAARLRTVIRTSDRIARLGGDEFAVLLAPGPDQTDPLAMAHMISTRIIETSRAPIDLDGVQVSVSVSVGIAVSEADSTDIEHLLTCADTAMYAAKQAGKGRFAVFEPYMLDEVLRRASLRQALEAAIAQHDFTLVYQPSLRLSDRSVVGFEALLRWVNADGDSTPPMEFVPVAEETGQIVPIGRWVLQEAVAQLAFWQQSFERPELTMSINVSVRQLTDVDFVSDVAAVLAKHAINPKTLTLELTETMFIADPEAVASVLAQLRRLGVLIAIDDYGTGNASISYLRSFAVDVLKVDRSLVVGLDEDPAAGRAVVRSITDLAASLKLTTIAEGIEREDQIESLRALGCDEGQGFHLARPLSADQASEFLREDTSHLRLQLLSAESG
jgi:diguanylate cyclase (GGDEF)-like protein